ncbi:MAG: hypothetical protein C5B50_13560 [Verrucomicrobia bacterium]|nr:MAG: hypothetical protein C5B50_13560 [Verrucomicrobiota bacterium]
MVLVISLLTLGCRSTVPHPPAFSDFQRAFNKGLETQAGWEAQTEVFAAAMLSDREMYKILVGTNVQAMIGAGLQGRLDDNLDLALLERAASISPSNAAAWAAVAYRSLTLLKNHIGDIQTTGNKFRRATDTMSTLAPTNSVPLYLRAAFDCLETNIGGAKELIVKAYAMDGFDTYETTLKVCVIQALESVGYSEFTARIVASGNAPATFAWPKLDRAILAASPSTEEVRACLLLGARVASGGSFLDQLVGDSIQLRAMEKLDGPQFAMAKRRITEQKERIKHATRYLGSVRTRNVTEKQWVQYYDRCFKSGEMDAVQWLAEKMGDTF